MYMLKRYFPICKSSEDLDKLKQFKPLCERFLVLLDESVAPYRVPSCLRCCFRGQQRTSYGVFCNMLFGETKQLGFILQRMFNADHHWVPVEEKTCTGKQIKLDCMFFRGANAAD